MDPSHCPHWREPHKRNDRWRWRQEEEEQEGQGRGRVMNLPSRPQIDICSNSSFQSCHSLASRVHSESAPGILRLDTSRSGFERFADVLGDRFHNTTAIALAQQCRVQFRTRNAFLPFLSIWNCVTVSSPPDERARYTSTYVDNSVTPVWRIQVFLRATNWNLPSLGRFTSLRRSINTIFLQVVNPPGQDALIRLKWAITRRIDPNRLQSLSSNINIHILQTGLVTDELA